MIVRKNVQNITNDESATDDLQKIIGHYHKCLAEAFGRVDSYYSYIDDLEGFTNDDVPCP